MGLGLGLGVGVGLVHVYIIHASPRLCVETNVAQASASWLSGGFS